MIISQISTATGRLTLRDLGRADGLEQAGEQWPSAMPATMQSATQRVR